MINNLNNVMRSRDITVVLGTSMTIETNVVPTENRKFYALFIGTAFPDFTGTEAVQISINGVTYPVIDNFGNIVVSGRLRDGRFIGFGTIRAARYRLSFGSDGMPSAIPHFVIHEGLAPMIFNGTAGSNDNTTPVVG